MATKLEATVGNTVSRKKLKEDKGHPPQKTKGTPPVPEPHEILLQCPCIQHPLFYMCTYAVMQTLLNRKKWWPRWKGQSPQDAGCCWHKVIRQQWIWYQPVKYWVSYSSKKSHSDGGCLKLLTRWWCSTDVLVRSVTKNAPPPSNKFESKWQCVRTLASQAWNHNKSWDVKIHIWICAAHTDKI